MAGGIDWFRWHHGSVSDQKFPLVARRASASVAEVIAVWACLLERASMNEECRGALGDLPDFEAMDCALGMPDGRAQAIFEQLQQRAMIDEHLQISAWPRRQPKREDAGAAERQRAKRARDAEAQGVTSDQVTQSHTESREVTTEESREEKNKRTTSAKPTLPCPYQDIVGLYHDTLPTLPSVRLMDDKRQRHLRDFWGWVLSSKKSDGSARATTADEAMAWIRGYFERAAENDFLMGRTQRRPEHERWRPDIDFLVGEKGRKHVIERTQEAA